MIDIRTFRQEDLPALVTLINEADAFDRLERATTLEELNHQLSFPGSHPETDCFLVWDGDRLAGYARLYVARGDAQTGSTVHCWGVVHPQQRQQGVGYGLLEAAYRRASEILAEIAEGRVDFQCLSRDVEEDRRALFESFGMRPVRYFVNLVRPINNGLPPAQCPTGYRLRPFELARDLEAIWKLDNAAFADDWSHVDHKLEDFVHWVQHTQFRPELCLLAEDEASAAVVGMGLNIINPDWIARTGRQEGYVDTLAVLQEHRQRGLGTALLVHSLHVLQQAGMEAAHLHADAENPTGAMRLYQRVGFRVRKTDIAYRKRIRG